jgi:cytosine/adenosine deaminase-related metal-dependent hydrolase
MAYKPYTHDVLIKNSNEILYNAEINLEQDKIVGFSSGAPGPKRFKSIVLPGLINMHSHLCFSKIKLDSQNLFSWLKDLVKESQKPEFLPSEQVSQGIQESLSYGTTFVVENTNYPFETSRALIDSGIKALMGIEIFGSDPNLAQKIFQEKIALLDSLPKDKNIAYALSPHATYDVSALLWKFCLEWSQKNNRLLLSHISESLAEEKWFSDHDSTESKSAKEFWASINSLEAKLYNWKKYKSSFDFLLQNNLLDPNLLLTHGVYLSEQELDLIQQYQIKLVTCPRSNEYLLNDQADIKNWQNKKIQFALGTDSKASNHDLDLREELKHLPSLSFKEKFEMITIKAATMLGLDSEIGSLEQFKSADFVVLEILDLNNYQDLRNIDIFALALDNKKTRVREVFVNGSLVYKF